MGLDAGKVLKQSVRCPHCNDERLFTLRAIAEHSRLQCHGCGSSIDVSDSVYQSLLSEARHTLAAIDSAQLASSFMNRR